MGAFYFGRHLRCGIMSTMTQAKTKKSPKKRPANKPTATIRTPIIESDSTYFLKLIVVVLLGTLWIKLQTPVSWQGVPFGGFPLGAVIGLMGIHLWEKNQTDRKIWFAALVIVTIICYFMPAGIVI